MTSHRRLALLRIPGTALIWIAILCSFLVAAQGATDPTPTSLTFAEDLETDGRWARAHNMAILVVVTREDCQHCALLKRNVLIPMLRSGDYDDKVLIRELMTNPLHPVVNFRGRTSDSAKIASRLGARVTPTVLLLDADGKALNPAIIGINSIDFYGHYLDAAIDTALAQINKDSTSHQGRGN